jgi:hypothetical protein
LCLAAYKQEVCVLVVVLLPFLAVPCWHLSWASTHNCMLLLSHVALCTVRYLTLYRTHNYVCRV